MASNELKISQKFNLGSFQGIDEHRELVLLQKVVILTYCIQNRHLNLYMEAVWGGVVQKGNRKRNRQSISYPPRIKFNCI